jgi:hypothetical protein
MKLRMRHGDIHGCAQRAAHAAQCCSAVQPRVMLQVVLLHVTHDAAQHVSWQIHQRCVCPVLDLPQRRCWPANCVDECVDAFGRHDLAGRRWCGGFSRQPTESPAQKLSRQACESPTQVRVCSIHSCSAQSNQHRDRDVPSIAERFLSERQSYSIEYVLLTSGF